MARRDRAGFEITPDLLLKAYACGIFPMAETADDPHVHWIDPRERGVIFLDEFHIPRSLKKVIRRDTFDVRVDTAFPAVLDACGEPTPERPQTWINATIRQLYLELFRLGHAHSVESWREGQLVGGLYGVSLGGVFFGESMFSRERDASKVALVHLWDRLRRGGYVLLDTQFITGHLARFGAREIPRADYQRLLEDGVTRTATFQPAGGGTSDSALQPFSHTS
ncbi:leucyl/phenylalanyl-tRNA--protein transferase [Aurantimonas sp. MSK8Z-1]|uniref:leucyl/phenylalanyl-tRNA--protein transferase n=1 Tax=Mangrovibrevibacter kandeliae TaxID=2968473 RepID=UPI0021187D16|nr:leucyl/phenylalanyl-tRNA--protein transferase [Aurantimonas sp. MSK8Z-1]MCW4114666.1 leucyl/phenylalanyl-tRNA--protein transferase [Aurantimonas sp. MSK8Z-1]